jgi:hypothetical protein
MIMADLKKKTPDPLARRALADMHPKPILAAFARVRGQMTGVDRRETKRHE